MLGTTLNTINRRQEHEHTYRYYQYQSRVNDCFSRDSLPLKIKNNISLQKTKSF